MDAAPDQILQRLEELRRWQEEQHNALLTKQIAQREMLHLEKNKLYEMFGLSLNSTGQNETASESDVHVGVDDFDEQNDDGSQMHPGLLKEIQRSEEDAAVSCADRDEKMVGKIDKTGLKTIDEETVEVRGAENVGKRSFLKRGEGLKARFKVHPDELRLNNIPKYKFAGTHTKYIRKKRSNVVKTPDDVPDRSSPTEEMQNTDNFHPPSNSSGLAWKLVLNEPKEPRPRTRSNISVQDTPTRQLIQEQQREIDELDLFEHLEANMQSFAPTEFSQESSSIQPGYSMGNSPSEAPGRVKFMSQVQINEVTELSDSETINSTDLNDLPTTQTSTPNTRTAFQTFKTQLFGSASLASQHPPNDTTLMPDDHLAAPVVAFIQQQSKELKQKLLELEREMELFRTQNHALTKCKQQLELDRVQLDVERTDMEERLNDERCKMEVYLHDERMKLLTEKETIDRRAKELRAPNRKEREETTQLKAQVVALEGELATKEQRHVAAQARLRAQIRTMEKDLKDYSFEIENMKKENKKLDSENVKLRRQSNNKMLNEINKNIARLAPKATKNKSEDTKKPGKEPANKTPTTQSAVRPKTVEISSSSSSDDDEHQPEQSTYFKSSSTSRPNSTNLTTYEQPSTKAVDFVAPVDPMNEQQNCKREILNEDGSRDILYPNGNIKKVSKNAMLIRMLYFNKDVKETNINEGTVKYYYAATNTWHTSYLDGLEILEFPNGQTEHRFKDGRVEVHLPNGAIRITDVSAEDVLEEWRYPDGTQVVQMRNGEKVLSLPNGQREIHTEQHKRREYPDGTVKLVYPDGSQETRYSNGRIRLKDKSGNLVMDSDNVIPKSRGTTQSASTM